MGGLSRASTCSKSIYSWDNRSTRGWMNGAGCLCFHTHSMLFCRLDIRSRSLWKPLHAFARR